MSASWAASVTIQSPGAVLFAAVAADLLALEPDEVAGVDAVLEDGVDGRGVPVAGARTGHALLVQQVGEALAAEAVVGRQVEAAPDDGHLVLGAGRELAVLPAAHLDLLQPVAVGDAPAVDEAPLGVLAHALHGLGGEVHRVELVDHLDHPLVQEALGGLGVVGLGDGLHRDAVLAEQALEEDGLPAVPAEAVELVDQDVVDSRHERR